MISVIVPNYNHANYLKKRIDSILAQTYQNYELIILDDCSTDDSRQVIEKYRGQPKVANIVYNAENSGAVFKQWKKGVALAKGEFIWIAESDDYTDPLFLETMFSRIQQDPQLGFVYCDAYLVDEVGEIATQKFSEIRNNDLHITKWSADYARKGFDEISENLLKDCTINNASGVLFRKSAIEQADPFDLSFKYIGDWYCYLKICLIYNMAYINLPLNYYRAHTFNASKSLYKNDAHVAEYFLLFNWAFINISFIDKKIILKYFKLYTRHSLLKGIRYKFGVYRYLHGINARLTWHMLGYNIVTPIKERFYNIKNNK